MLTSKDSTNISFWLITIAILLGLTLPVLIQDGMFLDGVYYSCIAHNLSQGIGDFWFAIYSRMGQVSYAAFHEQPPLVFGIEALCYKLLGDSIYTERIYTFMTMVAAAWLIHKLWQELFKADARLAPLSWLPILLWITMPICFWSYRNNMCENTMAVFALAAVWFLYRYIHYNNWWYVCIAAILIVAASLSKGPPGLFPIATIAIAATIGGLIPIPRAIYATCVLILIVVLCFMAILSLPHAADSLYIYFFKRLLGRVQAEPTVGSHWVTLVYIAQELITSVILLAIVAILRKKRKKDWNAPTPHQSAWQLIVIGAAGTLPLMLTLVQKAFYMVAAMPYFAMGIAMWLAPAVHTGMEDYLSSRTPQRILRYIGTVALLFSIAMTAAMYGKTSRDTDVLHDVYTMGKVIGKHQSVMGYHNVCYDLVLENYLVRNFNIEIVLTDTPQYFIWAKNTEPAPPAPYQKVNLPLVKYELYKR